MAISRQALDQVRSILRELDQRIDDARHQRTSDDDAPDGALNTAPADESPGEDSGPPPSTPGRARPKRPSF